MSASIKPPTGSSQGVSSLQGPADVKPSGLSDAESVHATSSQAAAAAVPNESVSAGLLRKLEAGQVSRQQALDGLVAQALEAHGGARLPATQRAELEQVLRAALQDDPVLSRLLGAD